MDEQTIQQLINLIISKKMPEWWLQYAGQIAYNLQVHTKGLMFDKITGLYPHEHPDSQKHCIQSYESITKGSIWKGINNIIRIFNNSSYNIQVSERLQKVIDQYQQKEGSFFSDFMEDWIKWAIATDPNGICVVYPPDYTEDLYRYVCFSDIIYRTDEILIFKSAEESEFKIELVDRECIREVFFDLEFLDGAPNVRHTMVRTFNRELDKKYMRTVFHAFTKTHFVRFFKLNEGDSEFQYEYEAFAKPFDTLPYFENGGVEVEEDVYESFVQPFIPFGNLSLISHRNQRAVDLMFSYPRMSEIQQPCDACGGTGQIYHKITNDYHICNVCQGAKFTTVQSPYKVYRKVADTMSADSIPLTTPSVEFYTPDAAILTYNNDQWKGYLEQAEMAIFVQQKTDTGNVQAAKSKEIDKEEMYAWLAKIAKTLYSNVKMLLQYLENYMNANPVDVSVEQPYSFAILTESEAFDELNLMLAGTAPVLLKAAKIDNFVNKFVSESSPVKRALEILKKFDLLLYYSLDDITAIKSQGIVDSEMVQKHILGFPTLIKMYQEDKTLFDEEDDQIILDKLAAEISGYKLGQDMRTALLTKLQTPAQQNGQRQSQESPLGIAG